MITVTIRVTQGRVSGSSSMFWIHPGRAPAPTGLLRLAEDEPGLSCRPGSRGCGQPSGELRAGAQLFPESGFPPADPARYSVTR